MLAKARAAAGEMGAANVEFVAGEAELLPFDDESFDVVIVDTYARSKFDDARREALSSAPGAPR
jgi:ubiquinone/menaquinone biosynthesis C-methylase UbiE